MIANYSRNNQPMDLLREAINLSANGEAVHHRLMLISQKLGFQGMKRLHRYKSSEDREIYIKLQNYCIDMFDEIIEPNWDYELPAPNTLKDSLNAYLNWELYVHGKLTSISNNLIDSGFTSEADLVLECLPDVTKEIEKTRRMMYDYSMVEYDMPYIKMCDKSLHDKMKSIENK